MKEDSKGYLGIAIIAVIAISYLLGAHSRQEEVDDLTQYKRCADRLEQENSEFKNVIENAQLALSTGIYDSDYDNKQTAIEDADNALNNAPDASGCP